MLGRSCIYITGTTAVRVFLMVFLPVFTIYTGCGSPVGDERPPGNSQQTARAVLEHLLPDNDLMDGWKMLGTPVFYDEDNLFEYINGGAEEYRAYDFCLLVSAQYSLNHSEDESITVDIYDMGADANAFGIYSVQRYPEADYMEIGGQGFFTQASLEFWKSRYFVKISTVGSSEAQRDVMTRLGQNISTKIKGASRPPDILSYLPKKGYVDKSAVFALRDVMGQSFLKNGVVAEYIVNKTRVTLFLTQYPSPEEAMAAFNRYGDFLKGEGGKFETLSGIGEGSFVTEVSFYGRVVAFRQGEFVGGIVNIPGGSAARYLLADVLTNLKNAM